MDILILLLPLLLLFFIMSRGRKQQRQLADLQASLAPGQEVITTAGLHARITAVHDTSVELEVAPGVRTTWARQAVARRVDPVVAADDAAVDQAVGAAPPTSPTTGTTSVTGTADAPGSSPLRDVDGPDRSDRPER